MGRSAIFRSFLKMENEEVNVTDVRGIERDIERGILDCSSWILYQMRIEMIRGAVWDSCTFAWKRLFRRPQERSHQAVKKVRLLQKEKRINAMEACRKRKRSE